MPDSDYPANIRIAGNTSNPCLLALREKGYALKRWFIKTGQDEYSGNFDAEKNGRCFSATNPVELLGLVAMCEVRGDDWQTKMGEADVYDELYPSSVTYDSEGNVLKVGDDEV